VERRSALHLQRLARMVSEDEDGMVEGRIVSPPALPRLVPRSRAAAEHVPAHDGRAGAAEDVLGERCARVDLAAFLAVTLAERLERDQPIVELLTADPERMLWRLVRAGDEAVDRHRDVQLQLAHRSSLCRHARRTAQRVRNHRSSQELDEAGDNPVNAIVSVLMLREGWDVQNVTVVVGLRPYTAKANILSEQTIGRGLRLMFRDMPVGGYTERVDVIGNKAFLSFVDDLEKIEELTLETFEVGKDKLKIL